MIDYFLPRDVYFCCRRDALVFLDLVRDDYTLVNGEAAQALRSLIAPQVRGEPTPQSLDALDELVNGGLLTTDRHNGRAITPTALPFATEPLLDIETPACAGIDKMHVWRFVSACTVAAARLRFRSLASTVRSVQRRKERNAAHRAVDIDRSRELTAVFQKLRSLFPLDYLCLYDSLALIEFLARYSLFPSWVFAVRLEPWAAHCWIQEGAFVFNEGVEEAGAYTPVMVV